MKSLTRPPTRCAIARPLVSGTTLTRIIQRQLDSTHPGDKVVQLSRSLRQFGVRRRTVQVRSEPNA